MASTVVPGVTNRPLPRDPILIAPAVVAAALAIGWLGVREQVAVAVLKVRRGRRSALGAPLSVGSGSATLLLARRDLLA